MKNLLLLTIFLLGNIIKSQTITIDSLKYECKYLYIYQLDSTNKKARYQEIFLLKIGDKKSLYVSENAVKADSILADASKRNALDFSLIFSTPRTDFNYRIVKDKIDNVVTFYDEVDGEFLKYNEQPQFQWELSEETEKIADYECKIAYLNYAGRRFKTWYLPQVPISEGPYKFHGLPGLIAKMQDTQNFHKLELIIFKNVASKKQTIELSKKVYKASKTTKKRLLKAQKNYIANIGSRENADGSRESEETVRTIQARYKKRNNPLELKQ